ncbi:MAG: nucleoside triphosphate pyrophosphohydrolase [Bacteroidetes bacterium]|nr:nucleoside triphosphate pyrophosphohydrolase [Bacteroidota bacterium]
MNEYKKFEELYDIIKLLRQKCPWDKKQTFKSLRHLTIEEVYELAESILNNDFTNLKEELGDVLLHIFLYSVIAEEQKLFNIEEVIEVLIKKLINRHPHIFKEEKDLKEEEIIKQWEEIKKKEKKSTFDGIPKHLPSLIKSKRIQDKAAARGFDWELKSQSWEKVKEEMEELKVEERKNDKEKIVDEYGDILFSLVNYARFLKIDPDEALERANNKFINRFKMIEELIEKENLVLDKMSSGELNKLWQEAKQKIL